MTSFEYKVVPTPQRGLKARGIKGTPARFANALETVMNDMGAQGWEYQRTDTLPVEERQGLTGRTTTFQNMLVFRKPIPIDVVAEPEVEVAALIEDQSDILEEGLENDDTATPVEDIATEPETVPLPDTATDVKDSDARVNDTLKATFSFPWNKRATPNATSNDDVQRAVD